MKSLICFSHLRWDFVYQRPQQLMSRFGRDRRVFFVEEPVMHEGDPGWVFSTVAENVVRCIPKLSRGADRRLDGRSMRRLISDLESRWELGETIRWFYTPMMMDWAQDLSSAATVYDCMDELSKFRFAPTELSRTEERLFAKADLVFTGGHSLYLAKKKQHSEVYEFPSSIDASHFRRAMFPQDAKPDQAHVSQPRIGYAGVIDERIDLDLIARAADLRPDWGFVMLGPVVKIDPELLPERPNIHYLGMKSYAELPQYFAGWDVGMMPFALNESTEYISPTKTPEYLAAGLPVVSTAITDVVRPYGELGLVEIASDPMEFVEFAERAMRKERGERLRAVELFLADRSWDITYRQMNRLVNQILEASVPSSKRSTGQDSATRLEPRTIETERGINV